MQITVPNEKLVDFAVIWLMVLYSVIPMKVWTAMMQL
jgi:hypothetical protein